MVMIRVAVMALLLAACRGEGRSPDRAQRVGSSPAPAASAPGAAPAAEAAPAPPAPPGPPGPPPGTDKLVAVPSEVVGQVALREVVHGLARPVLVTVAPGDPRHRLFVVEQHVGRIRIVEDGKLLPKPFF